MKQWSSSSIINKRFGEILVFTGGGGCDINRR